MKSRAIFLLVIFLLNTIIGVGCALGMENSSHQHLSDVKADLNLSAKDLCCKTLVNDLVVQSKLLPEMGKVQIALPVIWLPAYFYLLPVPVIGLELNPSSYTDYRDRPPNRDIRTIIQSFQI